MESERDDENFRVAFGEHSGIISYHRCVKKILAIKNNDGDVTKFSPNIREGDYSISDQ